eukprot:SAG31_NODE_5104_length_2741_cov_2.688115_3_plen_187_part_00
MQREKNFRERGMKRQADIEEEQRKELLAEWADDDAEAEEAAAPKPAPARFRVLSTTPVTKELDPTSEENGTVNAGLVLTPEEYKDLSHTGLRRIRFSQGWVSECGRDGTIWLEELADPSGQKRRIVELVKRWAAADAKVKAAAPALVKPTDKVRVVTFSFLCPLFEKYGTFIARCNALIEKVSPFI